MLALNWDFSQDRFAVMANGYDLFSYFSSSKSHLSPLKGKAPAGRNEATSCFPCYRFANDDNNKTYNADPDKYSTTLAYGGFCAYHMAVANQLVPTDATAYTTEGDDADTGSVYLFFDQTSRHKRLADNLKDNWKAKNWTAAWQNCQTKDQHGIARRYSVAVSKEMC